MTKNRKITWKAIRSSFILCTNMLTNQPCPPRPVLVLALKALPSKKPLHFGQIKMVGYPVYKHLYLEDNIFWKLRQFIFFSFYPLFIKTKTTWMTLFCSWGHKDGFDIALFLKDSGETSPKNLHFKLFLYRVRLKFHNRYFLYRLFF